MDVKSAFLYGTIDEEVYVMQPPGFQDPSFPAKGEGSGTPTEPYHTPFPKAATSHPTTSSILLPSIPTALIPPAQEEEIVRLKEMVQVLEDREGNTAKQSGDDAPIKGRSINEGEAAAERISNDSEGIARVLTSMDAAIVLAGGIDVPTGSCSIPTSGPPATVNSTGSKGMIDSLDKSNKTTAKYLQEYQEFALELPLEKRIELISDLVKYQEHYTKVHKFQSQQ
nr:retrotransposon protein, putative, unclassified [Tanacetum cinerariifolium]